MPANSTVLQAGRHSTLDRTLPEHVDTGTCSSDCGIQPGGLVGRDGLSVDRNQCK